jgi:hypothetical protein
MIALLNYNIINAQHFRLIRPHLDEILKAWSHQALAFLDVFVLDT